MNIYLHLFLNYAIVLVIMVIGLLAAITDYREGKIKNKLIRAGIYWGLVYYAVIISLTVVGVKDWDKVLFNLDNYTYFQPDYYLTIILNTIVAFVLAFTLWRFKLWAGGDAKLFTLYVFLLPLIFYSNAYIKYWPPLNLLVNIMLPIFCYLVFKMLLFPLHLLRSYLKDKKLMREFFTKQITKYKFDKSKVKEYINTGLSFLVILILFQLIRIHVNNFLDPYLGNLVTASYFLMGMVIFKPLRMMLKKYAFQVFCLMIGYFIIGYFYFPHLIFSDLQAVFAVQLIFMMSYFYIFKYGRVLGQFLYNSSEVQMVLIEDLRAGVYINKEYIKELMGSRTNVEEFKKQVEPLLAVEEKNQLWPILAQANNSKVKDKNQYDWLSMLISFRLDLLPGLIRQVYDYKKLKKTRQDLLLKLAAKLNPQQQQELANIVNNTDDITQFLKSIKGRLNSQQAESLKEILWQRNKEIKEQGHQPIKQIVLHKTFSFAPFMLLGVIITVVTKSSLIHLIYQYILHR